MANRLPGTLPGTIWLRFNIVHQAVFPDMYYFAKPPAIADIYVFCDGAEEGIFVRGLPEMNISDIYLENMVLKLLKALTCSSASMATNARLSGLQPPMVQRRSATRLSNMEPWIWPWK